jgi:hypothetical protein
MGERETKHSIEMLRDEYREGCLIWNVADELLALRTERDRLRAALEIVRPHVDLMQAHLNGSYCCAKIDEHTFCGRGRNWPGHRSDAKEWPEHEFVDGSALVAALKSEAPGPVVIDKADAAALAKRLRP